jgi:etoposide-induced 2.4 mRNA
MLILPIFIAIRVISTLWFADVAGAAFRYRGSASRSSTSIELSKAASDFLHSIVVELIILLMAQALAYIPVAGQFLSLVYMSLLHSLYSFEYLWM